MINSIHTKFTFQTKEKGQCFDLPVETHMVPGISP